MYDLQLNWMIARTSQSFNNFFSSSAPVVRLCHSSYEKISRSVRSILDVPGGVPVFVSVSNNHHHTQTQ